MTLKINSASINRRLQYISEDFSELLADIKRSAESFPDADAIPGVIERAEQIELLMGEMSSVLRSLEEAEVDQEQFAPSVGPLTIVVNTHLATKFLMENEAGGHLELVEFLTDHYKKEVLISDVTFVTPDGPGTEAIYFEHHHYALLASMQVEFPDSSVARLRLIF